MIFDNICGLAVYDSPSGPEGLSYTASPQMLSKIMSEADRRTLLSVQLKYAPGFA